MAAAGGAATLTPTKAVALDCGEQFGPGPIVCTNTAPTGDATVSFGVSAPNTLFSPFTGISASIVDSTNPDDVQVTVGDDSAIFAPVGILATNVGAGGGSSVDLGSDVTVGDAVAGVIAQSNGTSSITAGSNLWVSLDANLFGIGLNALSALSLANADTDGASAIVDIGPDAVIQNNNLPGSDTGLITAEAPNGTASVSIDVADGLSLTEAGDFVAGIFGHTNLGDVDINVGSGSIDLTGGNTDFIIPSVMLRNTGILGRSAGGDVNITSGADITATANTIFASAIEGATLGAGDVTITSTGDLTADTYGILGSTVDGDLNISSTGDVDASLGVVGSATGTGSVTISTDGTIHGGFYAVEGLARSGAVDIHTMGDLWANVAIYAESDGPITIVADGDIGSVDQPSYGGVIATGGTVFGGASSDVDVTVNGDVYTEDGFLFNPSIRAEVRGATGSATIRFGATRGATLHSTFEGLLAQVDYAANAGDAMVTVGDGSTIDAVRVAEALNSGVGDATVQFGSGVTLQNALLGAFAQSAARSLVDVGDNLTVQLQDDVYSGSRAGLYASSTALADTDAPSAEVSVGSNATFTNTDTTAYNSVAIYAQAQNGTASAHIAVGDGLNVEMAGEHVVGVAAATNLGDIDVTVGTGTISLTGGDAPAGPSISPYNVGIIADAMGGDVTVTSAANIDVTANFTPVRGIEASTSGAGDVTVTSAGAITSTGVGIDGSVVDGALSLSSSGSVTADLVGISGVALGSGSVTLASSGSIQGDDAAIDVSTVPAPSRWTPRVRCRATWACGRCRKTAWSTSPPPAGSRPRQPASTRPRAARAR